MSAQAQIIDGVAIAATITAKLKMLIDNRALDVSAPCMAVVLVGQRADSEIYVKMKQNAAERIGIIFRLIRLPETVSQPELLTAVRGLNEDQTIDGILVQMPLPATPALNALEVVKTIAPHKDVDGFHPTNMGHLFYRSHSSNCSFRQSCTARAVLTLLDSIPAFDLKGKTVVIIGTGTVGRPLALMLMQREATVICCNKCTQNIQILARQGDVLIAACGSPNLIRGSWIKSGAVVIDVGINRVQDDSRAGRDRIVGDVAFEEARSVASYITPVPGGVGPMTVAMLMQAVVERAAAEN
jgi:5,10-methylene-tetrahydrofolate dehydrogenase/methenyl tetrahydrofolate cyclohydrolase